jgi:hypothetical protein
MYGWLRCHVYFEGEFHDVWLGEILRGEGQDHAYCGPSSSSSTSRTM